MRGPRPSEGQRPEQALIKKKFHTLCNVLNSRESSHARTKARALALAEDPGMCLPETKFLEKLK